MKHCGVILQIDLIEQRYSLLDITVLKILNAFDFFYSKAETIILSENRDKEYGPIAHLADFAKASANLAFGRDMKGLVRL